MVKKIFVINNTSGFTLLEVLIVLSISIALAGMSIPLYGKLHQGTKLKESKETVLQTINIARQRSLSGLNDSSYGIYFEINDSSQDRIILYAGESFDTRNIALDEASVIDANISVSVDFFPSEINFEKNSGSPDNYGRISFLFEGTNIEEFADINKYGLCN